MSHFGRVCKRKLKVKVGKSKVMRCLRYVNVGELLEEADYFKYLGLHVAVDGGCDSDVVHRMNEGIECVWVLKIMLSNIGLGMYVKKCLYEKVFVLTALYGA